MDVQLRAATAEDAPFVYQTIKQEGGWLFSEDFEYNKAFLEYFDAIVAVKDGQDIGFITWATITDKLVLVGDFIIGQGLRGKGIGSRLLREGPLMIKDKNIWLNSVPGADTFYQKFGFGVNAEEKVAVVRGYPNTEKASKVSTATVAVTDDTTAFLSYMKTIISMSTKFESLMTALAGVSKIIIAKEAEKVVGVALQRHLYLEEQNFCKLFLFADSVDIAIDIVSFISLNRRQDSELLLTVPRVTGNIRALSEHFQLDLQPQLTAMFTICDSLATEMKIDNIYSYLPL